MAEEQASDEAPTSLSSESLRNWLAGLADNRELSEEELVAQLVAATDGSGVVVDSRTGDVTDSLDALEASIEAELDGLESSVQEKIDDVRHRLVQVKLETDEKSPKSHSHPDLQSAVSRIESNLTALESVHDDITDNLDRAFDNYAAVLEYLSETAGDLEEKLDVLASAVLDLQEQLESVTAAHSRRTAVERLVKEAHHHGVSKAKCESCRQQIELGLLTAPRCPHCAEPFSGVKPQGFFRTDVLEVGDSPALEAGDTDEESATRGLFGDAAEDDGEKSKEKTGE